MEGGALSPPISALEPGADGTMPSTPVFYFQSPSNPAIVLTVNGKEHPYT